MKKWYESRTMWIAALEFAGGLALFLAGELAAGTALTVAGVIMAIMRYVTTESVE